MSLSGVRDVVGTPREDIEYELCAERLSARKKKKTQRRMRGLKEKKKSMLILIGTKFATFFSRDSVLSWN